MTLSHENSVVRPAEELTQVLAYVDNMQNMGFWEKTIKMLFASPSHFLKAFKVERSLRNPMRTELKKPSPKKFTIGELAEIMKLLSSVTSSDILDVLMQAMVNIAISSSMDSESKAKVNKCHQEYIQKRNRESGRVAE